MAGVTGDNSPSLLALLSYSELAIYKYIHVCQSYTLKLLIKFSLRHKVQLLNTQYSLLKNLGNKMCTIKQITYTLRSIRTKQLRLRVSFDGRYRSILIVPLKSMAPTFWRCGNQNHKHRVTILCKWVFRFHMKSAGFHEIRMKSGRFHEIWWISGEIHPKPCKSRCFNQNYPV